jgi:hypothetical protein
MHGTLGGKKRRSFKPEDRMRNSSRITSGRLLPIDTDMNNGWSRRWSDLIRLFVAELGGDNSVSQAERSLVRRIATMQVACEKLEQEFANNTESTPVTKLDQYQRLANSLRRMLITIGIKRVTIEPPDLHDYISQKRRPAAPRASRLVTLPRTRIRIDED